jgi:hypothetical protein
LIDPQQEISTVILGSIAIIGQEPEVPLCVSSLDTTEALHWLTAKGDSSIVSIARNELARLRARGESIGGESGKTFKSSHDGVSQLNEFAAIIIAEKAGRIYRPAHLLAS